MLRNFICLLLSAALVAGCSTPEEEMTGAGSPGVEAGGVEVCFPASMQLSLEGDVQQRPMNTRATEATTRLLNGYKVILLKKIDTKWIVHRTEDARFDAQLYSLYQYGYTGTMPGGPYRTELTPGDYRIVLILNASRGTWNKDLRPGTLAADEADPSVAAPAAVTYYIERGDFENNGERSMSREMFVATADFTVTRSAGLGNDPVRVVPVQFERRVARFRFLLKNKVTNGINIHTTTENCIYALFTARSGEKFCDGIDAMGQPYYDPLHPTTAMRFIVTHIPRLFTYQGGEYMAATPENSHIFSMFLFTDPAREVNFDVTLEKITTNSGGPIYGSDRSFPKTLANNAATGLVLETDGTTLVKDGEELFGLRESMKASGEPENATEILGDYFEWNI